MLDIKRIKEDPQAVKAGLHAKEVDCDEVIDRILELDEERRSLIDKTLAATLAYLRELPDDQYFARLLELIARQAQPGEGELSLSRRDLDRLPADFGARLMAAVPGGTVRLSDRPCAVDGGFILQYGDIVFNCGFDALLEARRDEIEDQINAALFA